jgi:hypothetical protein
MEFTWRNKTNMGTGEIDPGETGRGFENRRVVKTRIAKIGVTLESAAGEIGLAIEARACERNG